MADTEDRELSARIGKHPLLHSPQHQSRSREAGTSTPVIQTDALVWALPAPIAEHTGGYIYLGGEQTLMRSLKARVCGWGAAYPVWAFTDVLVSTDLQVWGIRSLCPQELLYLSARTLPDCEFLLTTTTAKTKRANFPFLPSACLPVLAERTSPQKGGWWWEETPYFLFFQCPVSRYGNGKRKITPLQRFFKKGWENICSKKWGE